MLAGPLSGVKPTGVNPEAKILFTCGFSPAKRNGGCEDGQLSSAMLERHVAVRGAREIPCHVI